VCVGSRPDGAGVLASGQFAADLRVRAMGQEDVPAVMRIEQRAYPFPWSETIMRDCVDKGYACPLLMDGVVLVGYAVYAMMVDECHVLNLCIDPDCRRRGYGRYLLHRVLWQGRMRGAARAFLEVRHSNQVALQLYHSMGFNEIGCRKGYYPNHNGREDALVMAMELGDEPGDWRQGVEPVQ
jgi:ribosomal-protein-alanine N-acetyltransferase